MKAIPILLNSTDYSSKVRQNQQVPWQFIPVIDFSQECNDGYLKKFFGLTDKEIKSL